MDPRLEGMAALLKLMDTLREPGGCPWDRAQDALSLRPYLLEETYELLEALDGGEEAEIRSEMGDLLFQVVFHSRLHQEAGTFDFGDVAQAITDKLTRRHPHLFGSEEERRKGEARQDWEQLKKAERGGDASVLEGVPKALPALAKSQRMQDKAARVGFDWDDWRGPFAKVEEEREELRAEIEGGDRDRLEAELGDLLFSVVALARHLGLNAEDALRRATDRFASRFRHMEKSGRDLREMSQTQLEDLWESAKRELEGRASALSAQTESAPED